MRHILEPQSARFAQQGCGTARFGSLAWIQGKLEPTDPTNAFGVSLHVNALSVAEITHAEVRLDSPDGPVMLDLLPSLIDIVEPQGVQAIFTTDISEAVAEQFNEGRMFLSIGIDDGDRIISQFQNIPEPCALTLLLCGVAVAVVRRRG